MSLDLALPYGATSVVGNADVDFTAINNLEVTSIDFVNETHPGAFSTDELFTFGLITDTAFEVAFDNTVAGLNAGESATATLRLTWVALDNVTTDTIDIPLSVTADDVVVSTYTWDGGGSNGRWTVVENWLNDSSPPTSSPSSYTDVLVTDAGGRTTGNTYSDYAIKSLSFDESIDDPFTFNIYRSSSFVRTLTFDFGGNNTAITVAAGAAGDILFSDLDTAGSILLNDSLDIVHDGTGTLTFAITIAEDVSESNGITSSGSGSVIMQGVNSYTGDTIVESGSLTLEDGSSLSFVPTTNGVSNQISGAASGTGTVNINGEMNLNLATVNRTPGNTWVLVDATDLTVVYDAVTFSVNSSLGAFTNSAGVWSLDTGDQLWGFTQSTGTLELISVAGTFVWDGGGANSRWVTAENWSNDIAPPTSSISPYTDIIISDIGGGTTANTYSDYTIKSLTFGELIDGSFTLNVFRSSAFVRTLTFDYGGSNATIAVDADAIADILLSDFETAGSIVLNDNLNLVHNGTGTLIFDITIAEEVGESNGITSSGSGSVILQGVNSYTGDTIVESGSLTMDDGSSLSFVPTTNGVSNQLAGVASGTGTANLNGEVAIDFGSVDNTSGSSWALVDDTDLTVVYDAGTFSVNSSLGAFSNDAGVWTLDSGGQLWTFTQATGILDVINNSSYDTWAEGSFTNPLTDADPFVDFDNDGLVNLLEFVFGGDPTLSDPGIGPIVGESGDDSVITFNRSDVSKVSPAVVVTVEVSEDLSFTTPANDIVIGGTSEVGPIGALGASYTVDNNAGFDTITVSIPRGGKAKCFARIVAQP